jgi:hypothetical protein
MLLLSRSVQTSQRTLAASLSQPLTMTLASVPGAFIQGMQIQYFEIGPTNPHLVHVFHALSQNCEKSSIRFVSVCPAGRPSVGVEERSFHWTDFREI